MANILQEIIATKYREVAEAKRVVPAAEIEERARAAPTVRGFVEAIRIKHAAGKPAVIAEIKKASPSAGTFRASLGDGFDPISYARNYEENGAACLSVLTDRDYFQGAPADLVAARAACHLPVLRKDFIVDPYQIFEARAMGADAVLFIMGAVDISSFLAWEQLATSLGMAVLAESHTVADLEQALLLKTPLIGINNRDLTRFTTNVDTSIELRKLVPPVRIVISESGITNAEVASRLVREGIRSFLIGGSLMSASNPGEALAAIFPTGLV